MKTLEQMATYAYEMVGCTESMKWHDIFLSQLRAAEQRGIERAAKVVENCDCDGYEHSCARDVRALAQGGQ